VETRPTRGLGAFLSVRRPVLIGWRDIAAQPVPGRPIGYRRPTGAGSPDRTSPPNRCRVARRSRVRAGEALEFARYVADRSQVSVAWCHWVMASISRTTFGVTIRTGRIARGWTQRQLADRACVPQSVVCAVEAGEGGEIATLERMCVALGGEFRLEAHLPYAGEGSRQVDLGHARCVGAARRLLEASGCTCITEQEVMDGPWRGRIDLLGFDATVRRLVVVEVKTELRDAGGLERQVDRYARLCLDVARRHGWRVGEVAVVVLVLATAETDAFLVANREVMAGAFPIRGRAAIGCIFDREPIRGRLLLMLDPCRRGRRVVGRTRADGRRTPAPYRDYRAFVAAIGGKGHAPAARSPPRDTRPAIRST